MSNSALKQRIYRMRSRMITRKYKPQYLAIFICLTIAISGVVAKTGAMQKKQTYRISSEFLIGTKSLGQSTLTIEEGQPGSITMENVNGNKTTVNLKAYNREIPNSNEGAIGVDYEISSTQDSLSMSKKMKFVLLNNKQAVAEMDVNDNNPNYTVKIKAVKI